MPNANAGRPYQTPITFINGTPLTAYTQPGAAVAINLAAANFAVGDLVLLAFRSSTNAVAYAAENGWTMVQGITFDALRANALFFKVLTAADINTDVPYMGQSGASYNNRILWRYRPSRAIRAVLVGSMQSEATNNIPATQTIPAASYKATVIAVAVYGGAASTVTLMNNSCQFSGAAPDVSITNVFNTSGVVVAARAVTFINAPVNCTCGNATDLGSGNILISCCLQIF